MSTLPRCQECGKLLGIDETFTTPDQRNYHPQAAVTVGDRHAHVDAELAPLIQSCWLLEIVTTDSCQEMQDYGKAALGFAPGSAELFVSAATIEDLDDEKTFELLGWRMRSISELDHPSAWTWIPSGPAGDVSFSAYFPPTDIPELTRRLEDALLRAHEEGGE